ncbi:hypothetical protein [Parasediminibacterium sp. JCM 36343]|uniref:hypothetical protein n=1 Tax=Parasediminibacterium sp. JCM 36343 TaxID=3374279 RepID=UPI00397B2AC4
MQNNMDDNKAAPFVPFEKAWAGLQPALEKEAARRKKRKKRAVFFWLGIIAVALIGGAFAIHSSNLSSYSTVQYNNKQSTVLAKPSMSVASLALPVAIDLLKKEKGLRNINADKNNNLNKTIGSKLLDNKAVSEGNNRSNIGQLVKTNEAEAGKQGTVATFSSLAFASGNNKAANTNEAKGKHNTNTEKIIAETEATNSNSLTTKAKSGIVRKGLPQKDTTKLIASNNNLVDSTKWKTDSANALAKNETAKKKQNKIHFGLQFNAPLSDDVNLLDINTKKQPLSLLIPQFWISKQMGAKHSILLQVNPYAQFYLDNIRANSNQYKVTTQQGATVNSKPQETVYTETTSFNKLIAIEASVLYQYQLSSKIKIRMGIGSNWLQGALLQNKITKNNTQITQDSLYGIDKASKEWNSVQSHYLLGKFDAGYQFKKIEIGLNVNAALGSVFNTSIRYSTPVNTNLFIRWQVR